MRHRRPPLAALVAAIALGVLASIPGGPVRVESAFAAAPGGRLIVTWREKAPATLAIAGVADVRASASNGRRSVVVARGDNAPELAARLLADPRIKSVVPDARLAVADWPLDVPDPNDSLWLGAQGDMRRIGMPEAWPVTTGSTSVIVGVLDTGYEGTHEDLVTVPTVFPYNVRTGSTNVADGYGHGTHVAGTIAAGTNNLVGVAGIAPGVTIMPVKVMDSNGQGYWSDFLDGVDYAVANGASIINLSLGGSGLSSAQISAFQPTFTAARAAGVLVIAAAGNNDNNLPFYPASFGDVVSVSASTNWDTKASFSNYGPSVDISAPGLAITSTYRNNKYKEMSGTSMATPHVVGLAALIRSLHPEFGVAEVETALKATARDLGAPGRDDIFGHGRIRAPEALAWVPPDLVAPVATLLTPIAGSTRISEWVRPTVVFDDAVSGVDASSVRLTDADGDPVDAGFTYNSNTHRATLWPATRLPSRSTFRVVVSGAITDGAGNLVEPRTYSFTTGDSIKPVVTSAHPVNGAANVKPGITLRITFSEKVTGISTASVRLKNVRSGKQVRVTVRYDAETRKVTIDPVNKLKNGRHYRLKLLDTIKDLGGQRLALQYRYFRVRP